MQNTVAVTLVGNITADLDLNYTKAGTPVTNFNVATTGRFFDPKTEEWMDAETVFTRCVLWNVPAENAVESFHKGDRVIVTGNMTAKPWTDEEGNNRTNYELAVTEMGASVTFATLAITRNKKEEVEKTATKTATRKPVARKR
jgi:single-strand DNA-binding protein